MKQITKAALKVKVMSKRLSVIVFSIIDWSLSSGRFLQNVRVASDSERAGGFREAIACHRALQDAYCGLYSFPNVSASPAKQSSSIPSSSHSPMITSWCFVTQCKIHPELCYIFLICSSYTVFWWLDIAVWTSVP